MRFMQIFRQAKFKLMFIEDWVFAADPPDSNDWPLDARTAEAVQF